MPHLRLHDLRHIHATMLLKAGIHPRIVQERLGHSSIATTLDIYSHTVPGMQKAAAERPDTLLPLQEQKENVGNICSCCPFSVGILFRVITPHPLAMT